MSITYESTTIIFLENLMQDSRIMGHSFPPFQILRNCSLYSGYYKGKNLKNSRMSSQ